MLYNVQALCDVPEMLSRCPPNVRRSFSSGNALSQAAALRKASEAFGQKL